MYFKQLLDLLRVYHVRDGVVMIIILVLKCYNITVQEYYKAYFCISILCLFICYWICLLNK